MHKNLFPWLPITALLAGALACTSKSSNSNNDETGGPTTTGGANTSTASGGGGSDGSGGSGGTSTSGTGGSGGTLASTGSMGGAAGAAGDTTDGEPGAAGTSEGGTGGSGGTTTGPAPGDPCAGSSVEPNEDYQNATVYEVGAAFDACLQSAEDVDVYEFTVPEDDRGGVAVVSITEVGPNADTSLALWAAADNGEFHSTGSNTEGASVYLNFNAAPGATFHLEVTNYLEATQPNPYRLTVEYHQAPDEYEPNQIRSQAVPIEVNEDVEAYLFAGWTNSTGIPDEEWFDWYSVELEAGNTSILLDVMASDIDHDIVLYDPIGTQIANEGTNTEGSSVLLEHEVPEAGTYFVRVSPYIPPLVLGNSVDIPEYATTPYTLSVTQ